VVLGGVVQCSVVCGGSRQSSVVVGGLAVRAATSVPRLGVVVVRQVLQASSKFPVLQKQKERWGRTRWEHRIEIEAKGGRMGGITRASVSMRAEGEEWAILRRVQRAEGRVQSRDGGYARLRRLHRLHHLRQHALSLPLPLSLGATSRLSRLALCSGRWTLDAGRFGWVLWTADGRRRVSGSSTLHTLRWLQRLPGQPNHAARPPHGPT
jgi:hypothetical protein